MPAPLPANEADRIAALRTYELLDSKDDPLLNHITEMAASLVEAPMAAISLVGDQRQWFVSEQGIHIHETCRDVSFCAHAILNPAEPLIVPDALLDTRFVTNPLVTGKPLIRFYAGFPLINPEGLPLGTLCILDTKPRDLSKEQGAMLLRLSLITAQLFETYRSNVMYRHLLKMEKEVYNRMIRSSSDLATKASTFDNALHSIMRHLDPRLGWLSARFRNMQTGGSTGIFYNPEKPHDEELELLWNVIDSKESSPISESPHTEFVHAAPTHTEYSFLAVPVRIRDRLVALLEFLFPDHRRMDPRISEIFNTMAIHLSIVAERELVSLELLRRATHDELTGAVNRSVVIETLEKCLSESDLSDPDSFLFYIDLDGFKQINDNYGHRVGDLVLQEVAKRLRDISRHKDVIGRLSGDEFVLIARNPRVIKGLDGLFERLTENFRRPFDLEGLTLRINASIGAIVIGHQGLSSSEILSRAEGAMYLAKSGRRQGISIADEEVTKLLEDRRHTDGKIRNAIHEERLTLLFQPIVDLADGRTSGLEVLLRIINKDGSLLPAKEFIPIVDRLNLLPRIDDWVLVSMMGLLKEKKQELGHRGLFISLNVSPISLATQGFGDRVIELIDSSGYPPSLIILEIIETVLLEKNSTLLENVTKLRRRGVRIAIDDFGTGYSNLLSLSKLPIDLIKIDQSFVHEIVEEDSNSPLLLQTVVAIAKSLGYEIVAEGIETQSQADRLMELGTRYVQGYLYSTPLPYKDLIEHLSKSSRAV